MERAAIYRRALGPIALCLGILGIAASGLGAFAQIDTPRSFVAYWSGVGVLGLSAAYLLARRQALQVAESFWSAPTRRVTQALLPPLFVGFVASSIIALADHIYDGMAGWIVPVWMVLYGCAVHAAGFFMPRGMKLFGWGFIVTGCAVAAYFRSRGAAAPLVTGHLLMGGSFGLLHVAYGIYLHFTEQRTSEA